MWSGRREVNFFRNPQTLFLILCTALVVCLFLPFLLGDKLFLYRGAGADGLWINWPMHAYVVEQIGSGASYYGWSFALGPGTSTASLFSYWADPFNLIYFLFQPSQMAGGMLISAIIKLIVGCLFFYKCLEFRAVAPKSRIILALLFCVNGYAVLWSCLDSNFTAYFFTMGILLGYEYYRHRRQGIVLTIFVSLLAAQSPYYLWMALLALAILAFVDAAFSLRGKQFVVYMLKGAAYILLGVGLAAFVFVPSCYVLLNNPRVGGSLTPSLRLGTLREYVNLFFGAFHVWGGFGLYKSVSFFSGPLFATGAAVFMSIPQLFAKNTVSKKIVVSTLVCALLLLFFNVTIPLFNGFSQGTYRWSWMLLIPVFYGAGKVFSRWESGRERVFSAKIAWITFAAFFSSYIACLVYAVFTARGEAGVDLFQIQEWRNETILIAASFLLAAAALIALPFSKKAFTGIALAGMIAVNLLLFPISVLYTREPLDAATGLQSTYYDSTIKAVEKIKENDGGWYRVEKTYDSVFLNDALMQGFEGTASYLATNNPNYIRFSEVMETGASYNFVFSFPGQPTAQSILGVKYVISKENVPIDGFDLKYDLGDVFVFENPMALPEGFMYYSYLDEEHFLEMDIPEKRTALAQSAALTKDLPMDKGRDSGLTRDEDLSKLGESPFVVESRTDEGISGSVTAAQAGVLFVSTPYDEGWRVYVDGVESEVLRVNIGFCGVFLEEGTHSVEFAYTAPGKTEGILVSLFAAAAAICAVIIARRKKKSTDSK